MSVSRSHIYGCSQKTEKVADMLIEKSLGFEEFEIQELRDEISERLSCEQ